MSLRYLPSGCSVSIKRLIKHLNCSHIVTLERLPQLALKPVRHSITPFHKHFLDSDGSQKPDTSSGFHSRPVRNHHAYSQLMRRPRVLTLSLQVFVKSKRTFLLENLSIKLAQFNPSFLQHLFSE